MSPIASLLVGRADIVVLHADERPADAGAAPASEGASVARSEIPCFNGYRVSFGSTSRIVEEASDWGLCRTRRLRLEEQAALQEEFRILKADQAEEIRSALTQIEHGVGDAPVDLLLQRLTAVQRRLYDDADEHEWW